VETIKMTTRLCDESLNGQTIDLAIGQTIEIRLPENPTTGFRWQLMGNDRTVCAMTSDTFKQEFGPPGHGGEHSWIFEAVRPGGCDVELRYRRRWADPAQPERMFKIHIHVENPERDAMRGH
jgi:inhibitor of cysteine peptidase